MKKIGVILIAIMLLGMLTACGGSVSPSQQPANSQPAIAEIQQALEHLRGSWEDNVFTSEYLGLRFIMPDNWESFTEEELIEMTVSSMEIIDVSDFTEFPDMTALNPITDAHIIIVYERLPPHLTQISALEFIEAAAVNLRRPGIEVNLDFPGTTRIGAYDWYSIEAFVDMHGTSFYTRYFTIVKDGFAITINIGHNEVSESVEEILAMFSPL